MGSVIPFGRPRSVDEAWERYVALVNERAVNNLWTDLDHNQRIAKAFDTWTRMYLAEEEHAS